MALDQSNAGFQIRIDKWNGTAYTDSLDVSAIATGVDWGYESWDQSGLRRIKGTLTIGGYPVVPLAEALDPRKNPARFQRGNRVRIDYNNVRAATLYITNFPLPAHPGSPELQIELGCALQLLSYRQPPSDAEEESDPNDQFEYSEERTAQSVISAYLAKAGLPDIVSITGTCSGSLFVQQKDSLGSWVEEAGKIAYANGHYLWQKPNGDIQISAIALSPNSPITTITIGGWDGEEIEFEPTQDGEIPVEKVITTGESIEFQDTGGTYFDRSEEYGLASSVSPYGEDKRITTALELITETFSGTTRSRNVYRYECFCAVNPFFPSEFGLTLSQVVFENWTYEGGERGRLRSWNKTTSAPIVAVAQDYSGSILVDRPGSIEDMALRTVEYESADYSYDDQDATIRISRTKEKIAVAIAPTLFLGQDEVMGRTAFSMVPAGGISEFWIGDHDSGLWRHKTVEYGSLAQNARTQQTVSAGQLATGLVRRTIETSNNGSTQPPSAERREPTKIERREDIRGEADFQLIAPSPFQERERYYDIPYGNTVGKLNARAQEIGTLLIGRSLGVSFTIPLQVGYFDWQTLHPRIDFDLPDGTRQAFLVDNLSFAIDTSTAYLSGDGIFVGIVPSQTEPAKINKPYRQVARIQVAARMAAQLDDLQPDILARLIQVAARGAIAFEAKREAQIQMAARGAVEISVVDPAIFRIAARAAIQFATNPTRIRGATRMAIATFGSQRWIGIEAAARCAIELESGYLSQGQIQVAARIGIQFSNASNAYFDDYALRVAAAGDNIREGREDDVFEFIEAIDDLFSDALLVLTFTDRRNGLGNNTNTPSFVPIYNPNNYAIQAFGFTEANRVTEGIKFDAATNWIDLGLPPADLPYGDYTIIIASQLAGGNTGGMILNYEFNTLDIDLYPSGIPSGAINYVIVQSTGRITEATDGSRGGLRQINSIIALRGIAGSPPQHEVRINGVLGGTTSYTSDYSSTWNAANGRGLAMGARWASGGSQFEFSGLTAQVFLAFSRRLSLSELSSVSSAIEQFLDATAKPAGVPFSFADYQARVIAAGDTIQSGKQAAIEALIAALNPYRDNIVQLLTFTDRAGLSIIPIYDPFGYGATGFNFAAGDRVADGLRQTGTQYIKTGIPLFRVPLANYTFAWCGQFNSGGTGYILSSETNSNSLYRLRRTSSTTTAFYYEAPDGIGRISQTPAAGVNTNLNLLFTTKLDTFTQSDCYENGVFVASTTNTFEFAQDFQSALPNNSPITLGARCLSSGTISDRARCTHQVFLALNASVSAANASAIASALADFVAATT